MASSNLVSTSLARNVPLSKMSLSDFWSRILAPSKKIRSWASASNLFLARRIVVVYDHDDTELRLHFVFHQSADLRHLDPLSAEW